MWSIKIYSPPIKSFAPKEIWQTCIFYKNSPNYIVFRVYYIAWNWTKNRVQDRIKRLKNFSDQEAISKAEVHSNRLLVTWYLCCMLWPLSSASVISCLQLELALAYDWFHYIPCCGPRHAIFTLIKLTSLLLLLYLRRPSFILNSSSLTFILTGT